MTKHLPLPMALLAPLVFCTPTFAGIYTDDMAKCLVASTTAEDKTRLVRWIFANAALHPEVASIASVSTEQRTALNQATGQMLTKLLTASCRKQTKEALRYEGPAAMQASFQVLGQVAMGSLMTHPAVGEGFGEIQKFFDEKQIRDMAQSAD